MTSSFVGEGRLGGSVVVVLVFVFVSFCFVLLGFFLCVCVNFCLFCFFRGKGCCSEVLEIRHRAVFFFFSN